MPQIKSPAYHFPDRSGPKELGTPFRRIVVAQLLSPEILPLEAEDRLEEITRLVETLEGEVVGTVSQRKKVPHPQFCFGAGKAEAIGKLCEETEADTVVFDAPLSPIQISNLEYETGSHVMDRTELILEIFARRARSSEAKLQVELAYLDYIHPKMGKDKQPRAYRGGVRGFAESALDKKIRAARSRANIVRKKIEKLKKQKEGRTARRDDRPTVALVGYTNAGKSTLLNALSSGEEVYADDRLFATLDTTTRRVFLKDQKFALVSDTVGFIRRLPHELVASFHSTLAEALSAKLLVHVADASSPVLRHQMEAVEQTLGELGAGDRNLLLVFNKADTAEPERLEYLKDRFPEAVRISAKKKTGLDELREAFLSNL